MFRHRMTEAGTSAAAVVAAAAVALSAAAALLVTGRRIPTVSSLYPHCILTVSSLYPYCIPVVVVVVAGGVIITYQNIVRRGKR